VVSLALPVLQVYLGPLVVQELVDWMVSLDPQEREDQMVLQENRDLKETKVTLVMKESVVYLAAQECLDHLVSLALMVQRVMKEIQDQWDSQDPMGNKEMWVHQGLLVHLAHWDQLD